MAKFCFHDKNPLQTDGEIEIQEQTAELVDAVKQLNRSVASLNRALNTLQTKLAKAQQTHLADEVSVPRTLH